MGRTAATDSRFKAMLCRDPGNELILFYEGATRWRMGDPAGMMEMVRRIGNDQYPYSQFLLAWHSASVGDFEKGAIQHANAFKALGTRFTTDEIEAIYHGSFQSEAQRQAALKIVASRPDDDWAPTMLLQLGEPARSFSAFEQGKTGLSDAYLNWLWQPEAWSRKARQDPSFQGFAKRMGMVDYWKKYGWPDLCKPTPAQGPDAFTCQ
jgi:hypothetical protein